jgi:hypothetical protein
MGYFLRWLAGWWPFSYRRGEVKPNGHISGGPARLSWRQTEADLESDESFGPKGIRWRS